jgi:hypothetical protein
LVDTSPFFLFFLLVLIIRNTETFTISLSQDPYGTRVNAVGTATEDFIASLGELLGSLAEPAISATRAALPAPSSPEDPKPQHKTCPMCAEQVKVDARVCRYCGHRFEPANAAEGGT